MFWIINCSLIVIGIIFLICSYKFNNYRTKESCGCIGLFLIFFTVLIGFGLFGCVTSDKIQFREAKSFEYTKTSRTLIVEAIDKDGELLTLNTSNVNVYNNISNKSKIYICESYNHYGFALRKWISVYDYGE